MVYFFITKLIQFLILFEIVFYFSRLDFSFMFKKKLTNSNYSRYISEHKKKIPKIKKINRLDLLKKRLELSKKDIEEKIRIMNSEKLPKSKEIEFESIMRQVFSIWCKTQNITMSKSLKLFYEDRGVNKKNIEEDTKLFENSLHDWYLLNTENGQHISYLNSTCPKNIESFCLKDLYNITFIDFLNSTKKS